ncbi:MAG: hypothetical protein QM773_06825 [Hyphomonadaceae bacterium]
MQVLFKIFPAMVLPALVYAAVALIGGAQSVSVWSGEVFAIPMASGQVWHVTAGALFLTGALACFFVEMLRTASPSRFAIGTNLILACAFVPCVALFILVPGFATNEFFLVCVMMLLDFLLDSAVLVFTSRRTMEISGSQ